MLQAIEWAMDVFGGRTSGRVEDDHGLMASLLEADPSQERTWFKVNGEGLHLLHEDSDRHSDCPIVGRRFRRMRFAWALRADVWNPAWIGPQECWLHLTDRLVGTPAILESADTSIARISLVMNEGGRPEA